MILMLFEVYMVFVNKMLQKYRLQQMKNNQKILQIHPHLSKLIDSLCFQLAVNIPDQNSVSLLEILQMRKNNEITNEQFKQLYKSWLQSKNVFDLFSAKQVKIFPKTDIISNKQITEYLRINSINTYLQLLHDVYDDLLGSKKKNQIGVKRIQQIQDLFAYLDSDGNIHLRLSNLFFLHLAFQLFQNSPVPNNYELFKPGFKQKNKDFCQVQGMVSLRWFKNYFIFKALSADSAKHILNILKQLQKAIVSKQGKRNKNTQSSLPNILHQAFNRWKTHQKFSGVFESKKKKLQIYHRIFDENEEVFFFNGGKQDMILSESYFIKKYGQEYIKALQIDNKLLKQFDSIVKQVLNQYLLVASRMQGPSTRHNKSNISHNSAIQQTPIQQVYTSTHNPYQSSSAIYNNTNRKNINQPNKSNTKSDIKSKDKTPVKVNKGYETKRFNVTPTNKNKQVSPFVQRQFGSTEKSLSKNKNVLTPTKSYAGYNTGSLYMGNTTQQVYKKSKKQGLEKDSFYEKLFFFKNKRVQSFDIVMKRLKGK